MSRKFEIHSSQRLVEELLLAGHTPLLWDPGWPVSKCVARFDALIPRIGNFQFEEALETLHEFETRGGHVLNNHVAYKKARNKWMTYVTCLELQIPTPYSELVQNRDEFSWKRNFPCIVKKLISSKGEGVFLADDSAALSKLLADIDEEVLAQDAYPESFGEDVRAFVVGRKIIASMKRKSTHDFRSNLALGATAEPCTLTAREEELVLKTAELFNLEICGIDILRTHKGSLILEVNPCPGLEGIEKYTQVNVTRAIIRHIEELCR
ncbi:RimK family alpha-L-glutamate ligase [Bdellovibrio sp. NC01]|uniref:ATP-grasp domain-containing protein n=1 Tax=Bdellovibrio sp. NC01 TaxID=2220073 RepID=UPI00143D167C|nr:RimK family alpha-L-glutamate ligase [Bdellovibrio sp. NC01]